MDPRVEHLLSQQHVIARRRHPDLDGSLRYLANTRKLVTLLPGIYTTPDRESALEARCAAACLYDPQAVIVGDAAAALTYWPELTIEQVDVAGRRTQLRTPHFRFLERTIPSALVHRRRGIRYCAPALTALDQVIEHGGDGIDRALRSRRATVQKMREAMAMTQYRRGNSARWTMLLDSRDVPWSAAERLMHRLLREAGIVGWSANVYFETDYGDYYIDIVFHHRSLCIEIDGREFHGADRFDSDRFRSNDLLLAGKRVLHFTWNMLRYRPGFVIATVRRALRQETAA